MPHHEIHASGSLDNSGCKRLRISSLVDDMAEEEIQENIFDLFTSGIELLDQMRGCGMDTANWNKMLHRAFDLEVGTLAALNQVLVILRRTLAARLAAHPGGPAAAEPAVPNAHVPASAPPANSAPAEIPPPLSSGRAHSGSSDSLPPPAKRRRSVRRMPEEFFDDFTAFTYQRGIEHIAAGGDIDALCSTTVFDAFKAQHPEHKRIHLAHYFARSEWMAAVNARDPTKFRARRMKSPLQEAATIQAKLALCPEFQDLLDWCAHWLRSAPQNRRKYTLLRQAFDAEVEAARASGSAEPPFTKTLDNNIACYGIAFKDLRLYVFPEASGTHPPQDEVQNSGDGFHSDHHVPWSQATDFPSDGDSQGAWPMPPVAAPQLDTLPAVTAPSDAADRQTTSFIDYSTEAGILLGGNGAPRAMPVSLRTLARSSTRCYSYPVPYPPTPLTTHPFGHSLHSLTRLPSLSALALKKFV